MAGGVEHDAPRFVDLPAGAGLLAATSPIVTEVRARSLAAARATSPTMHRSSSEGVSPMHRPFKTAARRLARRGCDADDVVRVAASSAAARARPQARHRQTPRGPGHACARDTGGAGGTRRAPPRRRSRAEAAGAGRHQHDRRQPRCVLRPGGDDHRVGRADPVRSRRSPSISAASATPRRRSSRPTCSCWCRTSSARSISRATSP